jgi:hypothetical protein
MGGTPIPSEALASIPLVITDLDADSEDPALQGLLVAVVRDAIQPQFSNQAVTRLPPAVIDQVVPILGTLTDHRAVHQAKEVVAMYLSLQPGSPAAATTLAALNAIQFSSDLCNQPVEKQVLSENQDIK